MSPRNFARRFKQATGEPPLAYLHKLRIAAAKKILELSYATVQDVGQSVGYDEIPFFRRLFKRHTGLSPSQYQRRSRWHGQAPRTSSEHVDYWLARTTLSLGHEHQGGARQPFS